MGKIKQGILGGFNGTTGSVVGASWKGIAYMRGKAQSIKNPRTQDQQENRTLFGQVSDVMSKAKQAINLGFAGSAVKKSAFNCAVQENMKQLVQGGSGYNVESLQFSKGGMYALNPSAPTFSQNAINVSCTTQATEGAGISACLVCVFDGDFVGAPFVSVGLGTVGVGSVATTLTAPVPTGVTYDACHCFVFAYDSTDKDASVTSYAGAYEPQP